MKYLSNIHTQGRPSLQAPMRLCGAIGVVSPGPTSTPRRRRRRSRNRGPHHIGLCGASSWPGTALYTHLIIVPSFKALMQFFVPGRYQNKLVNIQGLQYTRQVHYTEIQQFGYWDNNIFKCELCMKRRNTFGGDTTGNSVNITKTSRYNHETISVDFLHYIYIFYYKLSETDCLTIKDKQCLIKYVC